MYFSKIRRYGKPKWIVSRIVVNAIFAEISGIRGSLEFYSFEIHYSEIFAVEDEVGYA